MPIPTGWFIVLAVFAAIVGFAINSPAPPPSPLLHAAYLGDLATIERMLPLSRPNEKDASHAAHIKQQAGVRDQWNNTAMHWAAKSTSPNSLSIVSHLLLSGLPGNSTNAGGSTALHWSCSAPELAEVSRALLRVLVREHGGNASVRNSAGETPLHWAVDWQRLHAVDELLLLGAEANAQDQDGNTPLHKIKKHCDQSEVCTAIVTRMLKGGANVGLKNNFSRDALQYFNQDTEQQTAKRQREADLKAQRDRAAAEEESSESSLPFRAPASASQIEHIQRELEAFQRNMTEGVLDDDRRSIAREEERRKEDSKEDDEEEEDEDETQ